MDAFSSCGWSYDSLKDFTQISPTVQNHLKRVYLTLCSALATSAFGVYLHILFDIGSLVTQIGCFGSLIWLLYSPPYQELKRLSLLLMFAVLEGASIGPLINQGIAIDSSIIIVAFVGTVVAFVCFSVAAMLARRREYLYLGGLLSSGLSILIWIQIASSIFRGSAALFKFELYLGLMIFAGYIVVDTQEIIKKAHLGDRDYIKHSLTLFVDFIVVFIRILIIMLKNASEKTEKGREKEKGKKREE